jgi:Fe-S cluster biogenesis protein NfuA
MVEDSNGSELRGQVADALSMLRPSLAAHGGDIELVDVTDEGQVSVRLKGACHGCPGAMMTLRLGVERILREKVPGVTEVVAA